MSGYIGQQFGWRVSCLSFAVFGCIVAAAFAFIMPGEEPVQSDKGASVTPMRTLISALLPVILVFCMRDFCWWGATYLTPAMTEMNLGFSKKAAGTLIGLMSLTGVISQPVAGTLSDRIGRRRMLFLTIIIGSGAVVLFPFLDGSMLFGAALIAGCVLLGSVPIVDATAADIVPPAFRGRMFGMMMTVGLMAGAASPYIMGLIHDIAGGYRMAYAVLGASGLAGAALVLWIPSKRPYS
jgi:predicted MFS family arabinose efflux permease